MIPIKKPRTVPRPMGQNASRHSSREGSSSLNRGFLTSGAFLGRAYFDYFFTIIACLVILSQAARAEWAQRAMETPEDADETEELSLGSEGALWAR